MSDTTTVVGHRTYPPFIRPVARLLSNSKVMPNPTSIEITETNLGEPASARVEFSLQGLTAPYWFDPVDPKTAGTVPDVDVEIEVGYIPEGKSEATLTQVFRGMVTHVDIGFDYQTVSLTCQDYATLLINQEMTATGWLNLKRSDILTALATKVGLQADIDLTDFPIGQFRQYEHRALALASHHRFRNAWDVCVEMQRLTGYDIYVSGKTLYFKKPTTDASALQLEWAPPTSSTLWPVSRIWDLHVTRDMVLTKGCSVTVTSWDAKQRTVHSASFPKGAKGDNVLNYTFRGDPGSTPDRLLAQAQAHYYDVIAHGRTVRCQVHPQMNITPRRTVALSGTGTTFDRTYRVDSVTLVLSADRISKSVTLRNRGTSGATTETDNE